MSPQADTYILTAKTAIQALVASGLRTVYCYCPPRKVSSWKPFTLNDTSVPDVMDEFKALAAAGPFDGRVYMGFGLDNLYLGPLLKPQYEALREKPAAHLITSRKLFFFFFWIPFSQTC